MKKAILLTLILTVICTLSACTSTPSFREGTLLYDCGITSLEDIDISTIMYDETGEVEITDKEDLIPLTQYEYEGVCPAETLSQLILFPATKRISVSFNDKTQKIFIMEDGTIGVNIADGEGFLLYEAPSAHRLTPEKLEEIYKKYK